MVSKVTDTVFSTIQSISTFKVLMSNEVTDLAKKIHTGMKYNGTLTKYVGETDSAELQGRIKILEKFSKDQLIPTRSWLCHIIFKPYDNYRANNILAEATQLIAKYRTQLAALTPPAEQAVGPVEEQPPAEAPAEAPGDAPVEEQAAPAEAQPPAEIVLAAPPPPPPLKKLLAAEPTTENIANLKRTLEHSKPKDTKKILQYALKHKNAELIKAAREHKINNTSDEVKSWKELINTAAECDDEDGARQLEIFNDLIAKGIDVNMEVSRGETALEIACRTNNLGLFIALLDAGAHITKHTLPLAIEQDRRAILDVLIEEPGIDLNADLSHHHAEATRPILLAIEMQKWHLVDALVNKGVDLHVTTEHSCRTPLVLAIQKNAPATVIETLIKASVKAGVSIDIEYTTQPQALERAAAKGNLEAVKLLVQNGANLNKRAHKTSGTALESAVRNGHEDVALYLIEAGANFNSVKKLAKTKNLERVVEAIRAKIAEHPAKPEKQYYKLPGSNILFEDKLPFSSPYKAPAQPAY